MALALLQISAGIGENSVYLWRHCLIWLTTSANNHLVNPFWPFCCLTYETKIFYSQWQSGHVPRPLQNKGSFALGKIFTIHIKYYKQMITTIQSGATAACDFSITVILCWVCFELAPVIVPFFDRFVGSSWEPDWRAPVNISWLWLKRFRLLLIDWKHRRTPW